MSRQPADLEFYILADLAINGGKQRRSLRCRSRMCRRLEQRGLNISVGGLYTKVSKMICDGLVLESRIKQPSNYWERTVQLLDLTDEGKTLLAMRAESLLKSIDLLAGLAQEGLEGLERIKVEENRDVDDQTH